MASTYTSDLVNNSISNGRTGITKVDIGVLLTSRTKNNTTKFDILSRGNVGDLLTIGPDGNLRWGKQEVLSAISGGSVSFTSITTGSLTIGTITGLLRADSGIVSEIADGTDGQYLEVVAGTPQWVSPPENSRHESPSGSIDGLNAIFTLSQTPIAATLYVKVNGLEMVAGGEDFTLSGNTITFVSGAIPQIGDRIQCDYEY